MLTLPEELLLLVLDDERGLLLDLPQFSLQYALSGAFLMELALQDYLEADLESVHKVKSEEPKDALVAQAWASLKTLPEKNIPVREIIDALAQRTSDLRESTLQSLVDKGILKRDQQKFLWLFAFRTYPVIDDTQPKEVKKRISDILFSEDIPDPRDVALICLREACKIFQQVFSKREVEKAQSKIDLISKMDLIGRSVIKTLRDIHDLPLHTSALGPGFMP